jgi:hypothetical protein
VCVGSRGCDAVHDLSPLSNTSGGFNARNTTLTRPAQEGAGKPKRQARPTEEQFLLRMDGQTKRSFSSKEDAATAGAVIKKAYPLVVVTVVDTEEHATEIINA